MLVRTARIDRIAYAIGIDPLDDRIVDVEDKPVDVDEQPASQETAPAAELIVDTILRLQRGSNEAVTFLELLDGRGREAAAGAGIDGNVGQDLFQHGNPRRQFVCKADLAGDGWRYIDGGNVDRVGIKARSAGSRPSIGELEVGLREG